MIITDDAMRAFFPSLILLAVIAFAAPAGADDRGPRASSLSLVRMPGADSCPSPLAIARIIEERVGRNVFVAPSRAEMTVEAYVERVAGQGWHFGISVSKEDGTAVGRRDLWSQEPTCAAVAESAALAIALMIDPDAMLRPEPLPALAPSPARELTPPPSSVGFVSPAKVVSSPPALFRGAAEIATGVMTGILPGLAPAVFVRARAIDPSRTWGLEFDGAYFLEQEAELRANAGAQFALLYAGVSLCALPWGAGRISALLCAGANLGSMAVRGYGFFDTQPRSQHFIVNLAGRGRIMFRVQDHWTVLVGGDLLSPLRRDHFAAVSGAVMRELFRPSAVAGGFELGLAYEF